MINLLFFRGSPVSLCPCVSGVGVVVACQNYDGPCPIFEFPALTDGAEVQLRLEFGNLALADNFHLLKTPCWFQRESITTGLVLPGGLSKWKTYDNLMFTAIKSAPMQTPTWSSVRNIFDCSL